MEEKKVKCYFQIGSNKAWYQLNSKDESETFNCESEEEATPVSMEKYQALSAICKGLIAVKV